MIRFVTAKRRAIAKHTIIASVVMLNGVVLAGTGLFRDNRTLLLGGLIVTVAGVMIEVVASIVLSSGKGRPRV